VSGIRARDFQFLLVVAAVVALLTVLSMKGKERFIPRTEAHLAVAPIQDAARADAVCLSCHGGEKSASMEGKDGPLMPENHPLRKKNCRQCHRLERKKS
jgi:mono/diheme cytochrome c family protein